MRAGASEVVRAKCLYFGDDAATIERSIIIDGRGQVPSSRLRLRGLSEKGDILLCRTISPTPILSMRPRAML